MPFHFCMDEVYMILAMIPFIGIFFRRIHLWWHTKFNHRCHHVEQCKETHVEHVHVKKLGYLTKEDIDAEREKILNYDFGDGEGHDCKEAPEKKS